LPQGAQRVAEILPEVFEPAGTAGVAAVFFDLLGAAEGQAAWRRASAGSTPRATKSAAY